MLNSFEKSDPGQDLLKKSMKLTPLICPKFGGSMRIIEFIEDYKVVKKILDYLGIYEQIFIN